MSIYTVGRERTPASESAAERLVNDCLVLCVEGDDGETLDGHLVLEVEQSLKPFMTTRRGAGAVPCPLREDLATLLDPRHQVVARAAWVVAQQAYELPSQDDDGSIAVSRDRVTDLRTALIPFGLLDAEAYFHGKSPTAVVDEDTRREALTALVDFDQKNGI